MNAPQFYRASFACLLCVLLWTGDLPARADELYVPDQHPTIQAAIDVEAHKQQPVLISYYKDTLDFLRIPLTKLAK